MRRKRVIDLVLVGGLLLLIGGLVYTSYRAAQRRALGQDLVAAIGAGNIAQVTSLIDGGADVNQPIGPGIGASQLFRNWLDRLFGSAKIPLPRGYTPLQMAMHIERSDIALLLLNRGATGVNAPELSSGSGRFLLHRAARLGDVQLVRAMLDRGAMVDVKDGIHNTPLHEALLFKRIEVARLLLERGANPNNQDTVGRPIIGATLWRRGRVAMAAALVRHGANVMVFDYL